MTTFDTPWWNTAPPWRCAGCDRKFEDLGHVELAEIEGYEEGQSSRLCPSCWPTVAGWARRDRLVTEATSAEYHDASGTLTLRGPTGSVTEAFHGPVEQLRVDLDRVEDLLNLTAPDDGESAGGGDEDDGDQTA